MGRGATWMTLLALAVLVALPAAPLLAAGFTPTRLAQAESEAVAITPDQAAEIARQATGGRVLGVDRRGNGRPWYRVKVLVDGQRVRYIVVDAVDGRIRN